MAVISSKAAPKWAFILEVLEEGAELVVSGSSLAARVSPADSKESWISAPKLPAAAVEAMAEISVYDQEERQALLASWFASK